MPSGHSEYSHQLERLLLDVPIGDMCWAQNHSLSLNKLPQLRCLKQLEMTLHAYGGGSLLFFVMLTTACPLLSRFVVQFLYEARAPEQLMAAGLLHYERFETDFRDHHHPCLKLVKLIDIACYQSDLKFASALLQIAKSLDKIIIRPGTGYHGPGYLGPEKISTVRERAKSLEAYLAHGAKLVIL
ncbi:hypothetical protein ACH5RR_008072 [Cinchona calisaya]|uniref:Uncharacterized protein n=1 Tax=Cinchona calisaya TaxID=153742 RepID=A0ABD3AE72_9GENT